ncbi:MAG: TraR/DksA family transcriptional regulator [Candidatus Omnitrophica bacterium]|nr:TraR/DksA family transcriptional regulator [Candidatus Omnitrophota bacterium]
MLVKKLDKKKLDYYKKLLLKLKESFLHDITNMSKDPGSQNGDSGDISGHVLHMADVATDMYDREFNLGLASSEREALNKIEQALKRIDEESFGTCVECEKSIPSARLKALPYAETCLKCQEKIETKK